MSGTETIISDRLMLTPLADADADADDMVAVLSDRDVGSCRRHLDRDSAGVSRLVSSRHYRRWTSVGVARRGRAPRPVADLTAQNESNAQRGGLWTMEDLR